MSEDLRYYGQRYIAINYLRGKLEGQRYLSSFRHLMNVPDKQLVMKMNELKSTLALQEQLHDTPDDGE